MKRVSFVGIFVVALLILACSDNDPPTGPTTGSIAVTVSTTGDDAPTGYTVVVGGSTTRSVDANGSVTFSSVSSGAHQVELADVPDNCTVTTANPATATVTAGGTTPVAMNVECSALVGTIAVTVSTTGEDMPASYVVVIDNGMTSQTVDANGTVTFTDLAVGTHEVDLTEIPTNCSVNGDDPVSAAVAAVSITTVTMAVVCSTRNGSIQVTATTTGELLDGDGYLVSLEGVGSGTLPINDGLITFSDVPQGVQVLTISGIAENCELFGDATRSVEVQPGSTTAVVFEVECSGSSLIVLEAEGEIYTIRPDGSALTLLTEPLDGMGGGAPTWSPDGTRIAFYNAGALYVMNSAGSAENWIAEVDYCCDFEWSPDGNRIAFSASPGGVANLYVIGADGSNRNQITNSPAADREPSWSPDGSQIVFERFAGQFGGPEVYRVDADGSDEVQLTTNPWSDEDPTWSPDGARIAFKRGYEQGGESYSAIYTMDPDGSNLLNVSGGPGNDEQPSWSPDGTNIAFVGWRSGNADIFLVNSDGSGSKRLTTAPEKDEWPSWSPDGAGLVFCRRIELGQLFTVNANGTGETQLLPGGCTPDWSPFLP